MTSILLRQTVFSVLLCVCLRKKGFVHPVMCAWTVEVQVLNTRAETLACLMCAEVLLHVGEEDWTE